MAKAKRNSVPVYVGREYRKLVNMKAADRDVRPGVVVEEALRAAYGEPRAAAEEMAAPCTCGGGDPEDGQA